MTYTSSPWSAKSRFVLKHSGDLRPVHQFCALNCQTVKAMGYTPSQLLIGFNPTRQIAWDLSPMTDARLESHIQAIVRGDPVLPLGDPELRVASLDEIRQTALDRMLNANRSILRREARKRRWQEPKDGDLVLLRRFSAEKHHGRKLEPQWEGPYRLADVAYHGRSGRLLDIHTNKVVRVRASGLKERCHLDDLKVFKIGRASCRERVCLAV